MTSIAGLSSENMCRTLTRGNCPIVTTLTCAVDLRVINGSDWFPYIRGMTGGTVVCCVDMVGVLTCRNRVVMTGYTCAVDL
jgi:hypothetical protein